jgi:hypothetical protein
VEKRAAVETGQEVDRADIKLRGAVNDQAEILKRTFSFEELDQMQRRMRATIEAERAGKVADAPIDSPRLSSAPPDQPKADTAADAVVPSVPKAPKSWRD